MLALRIWIGHYFSYVAILLAVPILFSIWTTDSERLVERPDFVWYRDGVIIVLLIFLFASTMGKHDYSICSTCVAHTPLDPQAKVSKPFTKFRLRMEHIFNEGYSGTAISLITFPLFIWSLFLDRTGLLYKIIWTFLLVTFMVSLLANTAHRILLPWCPFCHWGGQGEDEESPVLPDPVKGNA